MIWLWGKTSSTMRRACDNESVSVGAVCRGYAVVMWQCVLHSQGWGGRARMRVSKLKLREMRSRSHVLVLEDKDVDDEVGGL